MTPSFSTKLGDWFLSAALQYKQFTYLATRVTVTEKSFSYNMKSNHSYTAHVHVYTPCNHKHPQPLSTVSWLSLK